MIVSILGQVNFPISPLDSSLPSATRSPELLSAVSAAQEASEVERQKYEVLRVRFEEQARHETRKAAVAPIEGKPALGLRPWREVVTPQPDVTSGRYLFAEFAADLGQVHRGAGSDEYRVPRDFFQRTFLTHGLRRLLIEALQRLSGGGGDPVVDLQTNFGGGKTHSLLALYHLFSSAPVSDLVGIEPVLQTPSLSQPPQAQRAVLVGYELSPGQPRTKPDGCAINTLWGELAWQLLGKDGFAMVTEADRQGVSPGSEVLRELFTTAAPCLILIDEWVACTGSILLNGEAREEGTAIAPLPWLGHYQCAHDGRRCRQDHGGSGQAPDDALWGKRAGDAGDPGDDTGWGTGRDGEDGDGELPDIEVRGFWV
jgi:hypothetical protein